MHHVRLLTVALQHYKYRCTELSSVVDCCLIFVIRIKLCLFKYAGRGGGGGSVRVCGG